MRVVYDIKLMRPACVILAAAYDGDPRASQEFDTEDWLLSPTPNLRVYDTSPEQLKQLVEMTRAARKDSVRR